MPSRVFRILYFAVIVLIVAILVIAITSGLGSEDDPIGTALMLGFLTIISAGLPLSLIFLVLNVWGLVKYKAHRIRYGIVIVLTLVWRRYSRV